jgi:predicted nucleic acid-binding protein
MRYVADANTFLAVALNEPQKDWLVDATKGCELVSTAALPYELGNALSSLVKRRLISPDQLDAIWDEIASIPVALAEVDIHAALMLAAKNGMYAYDAYYLQCALELRCPLLTLDQGMKRIAADLGIKVVVPT